MAQTTTTAMSNVSSLATRLPPLPGLRDILKMYKLRGKRQLAQNFLLDPRITTKLARSAGDLRDRYVCEVGPGPGSITRSILKCGVRHLTVIEKDRRFFPALEMLADASGGRMKIVLGDIMDFNFDGLFPDEARRDWLDVLPPVHIIGNLPFNIATHLIIVWLNQIADRTGPWSYGRVRLTLTFQKEVAERICAPILSSQRCRLSIMSQYLCNVDYNFTISGGSFVPKPEVDAGVVRFTPLKEPLINLPFKLVEKVTRCLFQFRQKYCLRGMEMLFPLSKSDLVGELFRLAQVDPKARPFQLTVEEIGRLCKAYSYLCEQNEGLGNYHSQGHATRVKTSIEDIVHCME